jgi:hypothetical protein
MKKLVGIILFFSGLFTPLVQAASSPTITGTSAGAVNDNATIFPFSAVTIGDSDPDNVSVTITWSTANGTLNVGGTGSYTLTTDTPTAVTTAIRLIEFTPEENQVASNSTVITTFTIAVTDSNDADPADDVDTVITATSINDAPTITDMGTYSLGSVNEETASTGVLVSTILADGGISGADVDFSASSGIAITAKSGTGSWEFSTDDSTWTDFGTVAGATALLLDSASYVRFTGDTEYAGTSDFTFKAWDQTTGIASTNGSAQTADSSTNGNATAYSTGDATAILTVDPTNDATILNLDVNDSSAAGGNDFDASFSAGGAPVKIADIDTGVTDADDTNIESGQILLSAGVVNGADETISIDTTPATMGTTINITYTSATQIDLSGSATLADYETVIEAIEYNNAAATNAVLGGDRSITVTLNDGDVDSNTATSTITVIGVPQITSATYDEDTKALVVTGINFIALAGATNDVDATTLTLAGDAGGTATLTGGQTSNVELTNATEFTVTIGGTDVTAVEVLLNINGSQANDMTVYNLAAADDFIAGHTVGDDADATNAITVSGWPEPTITSSAYDANTGILTVTGTDFIANGGGLDVDASLLTFTGEDGVTYTLTDTADVEITNATTFSLTLSGTDIAEVNGIINKDGASSTGTGSYNLAAADNFITVYLLADTADATDNSMTASNVPAPSLSTAIYNATAGTLIVSGSDVPFLTGGNNDIDASTFTITGEGGSTYTLVGSPDVERSSTSSFTITLDGTDKAELQKLINKDGLSSTNVTTYNLAAIEDWARGADAAVNIVDTTTTLTANNVPPPTITSATYDSSTGNLVVTGSGFLKLTGATNDIDLSVLTLTGEGGASYTLVAVTDVEVASSTRFTATLTGGDKSSVDTILHLNGTESDDTTVYNLAAADNWNSGADGAANIADTTSAVTVSGYPVPSIVSATYAVKTGVLNVTGVNFEVYAGADNDIDVSTLTFTGQGAEGASYSLTSATDVEITNATSFSLTLAGADKTAVDAILTKNGSSATDATTYNLAAADDFNANVTLGDTSDSNASITVSTVAPIVSVPFSAVFVDAANQTVSGTYPTDGLTMSLYLDADNDGVSDGGADVGTFVVAGGAWSISAALSDDAVFNFVIIADFGGGEESAHVDVPTITEDSTAPVDPVVTAPASAVSSSSNNYTISGTHGENGVTVKLYADSNNDGTADNATVLASDVVAANAWSFTQSLTTSSANNYVVIAEDAIAKVSLSINVPTITQFVIPPNSAPVIAQGKTESVSMDEDGSPSAFSLTLNASDVNSDSLIWSITSAASNGSASVSGTGSSKDINYTPTANFHGSDSFTVQVSDGNGGTDGIVVSVTVNAVNDPALGKVTITGTAIEGASLTASNTLTDLDGLGSIIYAWKRGATQVATASTYVLVEADVGNTLTVSANYTDLQGNAETVVSAPTATIANLNEAPIATEQNLKTAENTPLSIVLTANDVDLDPLTYSLVSQVRSGVINGSAPNLTYTPDEGFSGIDSFTFKANDSALDSNIASINIEVIDVNEAPIATEQNLKTAENTLLSIILTASDVDLDPLTYSLVSQATSGVISGSVPNLTYTPDEGFSGTDSFTFKANDSALDSNIASINIEVSDVNEAPIATEQNLKTAENTPLSIVLTASDVDLDPLTYSLVSQATSGVISGSAPNLTYTPDEGFSGTDSFTFKANDSALDSNIASISIEVSNVNKAPIAVDDKLDRIDWMPVDIDVLANDSDPDGDTLLIQGAVAQRGTVMWTETTLSYTPVSGFNGVAVIDYSISDNHGGSASAQVFITFAIQDSDLPFITLPADVSIDAVGISTRVTLGVASAIDKMGNSIPVSLVNNRVFFKPGIHTALWRTTDSEGRSAESTQLVNVRPLVSLDKDQTVLEGYPVAVRVQLNGPSPDYPLQIPFTVSGTASAGVDHNLADGVVNIASGTVAYIRFDVLSDNDLDGDETIVIELDSTVNQGSQSVHIVRIEEKNISPQVSLTVEQSAQERFIVNQQQGLVKITSRVQHPDKEKAFSYQWSNSGIAINDTDNEEASFTFDPALLTVGIYDVTLEVVDLDDANSSGENDLIIRVEAAPTELGMTDTDEDGIPDAVEGLADKDQDGIPAYLDNIEQCNVLPGTVDNSDSFLIEGESGICLQLGNATLGGITGGASVIDEENTDLDTLNVGGIFDFIAKGLPLKGQSYRIVLPQIQPIPSSAVYRKKMPSVGWVTFAETADDKIWSANGELGFCPPPGSNEWQGGLIQGAWCVQLMIQDGGPNDADGKANGNIVDPGGVAVFLDSNAIPVANDDVIGTRVNTSVRVDVLANDTDSDGDELAISSALADLGEVSLVDNQLIYEPLANFVGTDTIVYIINDGNGGNGSAKVNVTVVANQNPVAVDDIATVTAGENVSINVLANDSDTENDLLQVIEASAESGTVVINTDHTLTYTAKNDFLGTDNLTYRIRDELGGEGVGQVAVTVNAVVISQPPAVVKQSSGGSSGVTLLFLMLCLLGIRSRSR